MIITIHLPDDIAKHLEARGVDPARTALEGLALIGYRYRQISEEKVRRMLGFETRVEVHGFLKQHGVYLNYTGDDLQADLAKPLASH
jgi:hypothetical protein